MHGTNRFFHLISPWCWFKPMRLGRLPLNTFQCIYKILLCCHMNENRDILRLTCICILALAYLRMQRGTACTMLCRCNHPICMCTFDIVLMQIRIKTEISFWKHRGKNATKRKNTINRKSSENFGIWTCIWKQMFWVIPANKREYEHNKSEESKCKSFLPSYTLNLLKSPELLI